MPILHIVLFEFKPTTTHAQVDDVCNRMLALSSKCLHPESHQPYVKSYGGGRDTSPEGLQVVNHTLPAYDIHVAADHMSYQGAFTHGFISEFQSDDDRRYYLERDPAHLEFVAGLKDVIQNVRVVDFEPGKF